MNSITDGAKARAAKRRSAGLRQVGSLLGGALLGTSIMTPILAGGDGVDGDSFVIFVSGVLALLGIGMHLAGSARHALANTASTRSAVRSRSAFTRRTGA